MNVLWLYMCSFIRVSSAIEELLPIDCPNINEFGAMHMNIHSDDIIIVNVWRYNVFCPYIIG